MEVKGVGLQICTVEKREDDRNKRREGETVNSEVNGRGGRWVVGWLLQGCMVERRNKLGGD